MRFLADLVCFAPIRAGSRNSPAPKYESLVLRSLTDNLLLGVKDVPVGVDRMMLLPRGEGDGTQLWLLTGLWSFYPRTHQSENAPALISFSAQMPRALLAPTGLNCAWHLTIKGGVFPFAMLPGCY